MEQRKIVTTELTDGVVPRGQQKCPFTPLQELADRDPFPQYEAMRTNGPVVWDKSMNAWLVLDFKLCRYVELHEEDQFRTMYADADPLLIEIKGGKSNITVTQGEQHQRLRRFHTSLLSFKALESYKKNIVTPIIEHSIAHVAKKPGAADLTADFGDGIPPRVICALLGMPWQDDGLIDKTLQLHEVIMQWIGRGYRDPESIAKARAASRSINELLLPYIRERRINPQDDFISRVWLQAPAEYGELNEEDALSICRELYLGGADTTVHGIANSLYLMLWNSEARQAVASDRARINNVVEEAQRLYGSPQYRYRRANADCELGGVSIRKNEVLILLHGAANRDPERFGACPAAVDLAREKPGDHLTFNFGPRSCVGAGLARMEMHGALNAVLDRLPNLRPNISAEAPRYASQFMRSFRPLNVLFDAQAR
ncbi:MAG TPA: cytochrome P450 [Steroidobacteraceae bacterium]|nr:cytochrome P450 [Steroidobacteraceae bacterium]